MESVRCSSCKRSVSTSVVARFPCPTNAAYEIIRCRECRVNAAPYECPDGSFRGPN